MCRQCGAIGHADLIAARNLVDRARGDWPNVRLVEKAAVYKHDQRVGTKPHSGGVSILIP